MSTQLSGFIDDVEMVSAETPVYRTLSRPALLSPLLGVLASVGFISAFSPLLILAFAGLVLGWLGYRAVRAYPDEYTGANWARVGIVLCALVGFGGTTWHAVEYATEVPEGYERISFVDLNPEDYRAPAYPPADAIALDGKKVFIKGYVYPDGQGANIKRFVLIPDLGTCCFGGQPKLTDMVLVTLQDPHRTVYNQRKRKLIGTLKVDPNLKRVDGVQGVYYQLEAESIQ